MKKTIEKIEQKKEQCMNMIRVISENEGGISEKTVQFIAKHYGLDPIITIEMAKEEDIKVVKI